MSFTFQIITSIMNVVNSSGYTTECFAFLGDTVYAATFGGGILMSPDNGTNWTPLNNGLTNDTVCLSLQRSTFVCRHTY